jgi:hypothetical protein
MWKIFDGTVNPFVSSSSMPLNRTTQPHREGNEHRNMRKRQMRSNPWNKG